MKVVSKFRIRYILSVLIVAIIPGMIVGMMIDYLFDTISWDWITGVFSYIVFFIYMFNPEQIEVTDEQIIFRNLIFRVVWRIKYDEIVGTKRDLSIAPINVTRSPRWNRASIYTREIKLKNGKSFSIDNHVYKNFKEIDTCIMENIEKHQS